MGYQEECEAYAVSGNPYQDAMDYEFNAYYDAMAVGASEVEGIHEESFFCWEGWVAPEPPEDDGLPF